MGTSAQTRGTSAAEELAAELLAANGGAPLCTLRRAARLGACSYRTLWRAARAGELRTLRRGPRGWIVLRVRDLARWLAS